MLSHDILFLVTAILAVTAPTFAQICPPADVMSPCECRDDYMDIYCDGVEEDLKSIFDRASPFVGNDVTFEKITLRDIRSTELPANTTSFKAKTLRITYNRFLQYIHPDAFPSTYETTTELRLDTNKLVSNETFRDLWTFVNRFKSADSIDISYSTGISHIPHEPFPEEMPNLKSLDFQYSSGIQGLGGRMLANLPNLESVQFIECGIEETAAFAEDTFVGIGPNANVNLIYNRFDAFPERIFRPALDNAKAVRVGGKWCNPGGCFSEVKLPCDEGIRWVCENEDIYKSKLSEYNCLDDSGDIWAWCERHNNK